jgi:hypothetical protein
MNTVVKVEEILVCVMSILIDTRIAFNEKRNIDTLWYSQGFSSIFELPSKKRNVDVNVILRCSRPYSPFG